MKDISEHVKDTAAKATVEETNKVQTAEVQRLSKMLCGMLSAKQFSELVDIVRKPEKMTDMLLQGLKTCGLLLENEGTVGTLHINVKLDMYPALQNLDEELDRMAEKYGTEYLAERLLDHPSDLASIQMAKAESEYMRGRRSRRHSRRHSGHHSGHRSRKEPHVGRHTAIFIEHVISDRLAMEAMTELRAAAYIKELMDLRKELMDLHKVLAAQEDDGK